MIVCLYRWTSDHALLEEDHQRERLKARRQVNSVRVTLTFFSIRDRRFFAMRRLLSGVVLTCSLSSSVYAGEWTSLSFAESLRNQARAYEHGEGVDKNPVLAASLYCDAARHG